jgi:hypothetical protein
MKFIFEHNNFLESKNKILINSRTIQLSEEEWILVLDNQRVENLIKIGKLNQYNILDEYKYFLDFGAIILIKPNSIILLNDIHGAYSLFVTKQNDSICITNQFNLSDNYELNKLAILELIHFNHFLGQHTLCVRTNRLAGGKKIYFTNNLIEVSDVYSWDNFLADVKNLKFQDSSFSYLSQSILESTIQNQKTSLTLTGGFDSRMLFGVLLKNHLIFDAITWSIEDSSQTKIARDVSSEFNIKHRILYLDEEFEIKLDEFLKDIIQSESELPFITDIPQFLYMCSKLELHQNLISGFMGSEIIRGPSYSSEVTLTKFAAQIQLCTSREEIANVIFEFQKDFNIISDEFVVANIDLIIDNYMTYSKINLKGQKNENIFKYLFREKYAKIYGLIIQLHFSYQINLINPFMDFKFILKTLQQNNAMSKFKPYENNWFKNFKLYRYYAKEIKNHYPQIIKTKLDRGYELNDLLNIKGIIKLIPLQFYRKWHKKSNKNGRVIDSFSWYQKKMNNLEVQNNVLTTMLSSHFLNPVDFENMGKLEKLKIQFILALNLKLHDKIS